MGDMCRPVSLSKPQITPGRSPVDVTTPRNDGWTGRALTSQELRAAGREEANKTQQPSTSAIRGEPIRKARDQFVRQMERRVTQ